MTKCPPRYARTRSMLNLTLKLQCSPCYLNIINPLDVAVGNNDLNEFAKAVREALGNVTVVDALADCLAMPDHELHFPEDL